EELRDEEFDQATHELIDELSDLRPAQLLGETDDPGQAARAERVLKEHVEPLARALEGYLDDAASRLGEIDGARLDGAEVARVLGEIEPTLPEASPAFEPMFGSFLKKVKGFASKAISLAGKVALGGPLFPVIQALLKKLKPLVRPLLNKVIKLALDKIP